MFYQHLMIAISSSVPINFERFLSLFSANNLEIFPKCAQEDFVALCWDELMRKFYWGFSEIDQFCMTKDSRNHFRVDSMEK